VCGGQDERHRGKKSAGVAGVERWGCGVCGAWKSNVPIRSQRATIPGFTTNRSLEIDAADGSARDRRSARRQPTNGARPRALGSSRDSRRDSRIERDQSAPPLRYTMITDSCSILANQSVCMSYISLTLRTTFGRPVVDFCAEQFVRIPTCRVHPVPL
jgi:hypothetical protein